MQNAKVQILNVSVDALSLPAAAKTILDLVRDDGDHTKTHHVVTLNPEMIMAAQEDSELLQVIEASDLTLADGIGVVWAANIFGTPVPARVPGIELVDEVLRGAASQGLRVFLLGAAPEVVHKAAAEMERRYPGMSVVGVHHGYFDAAEEAAVVDAVHDAAADLLLVALGAPRQETWIAHHRDRLGASVAIGVGGTFDVYAGITHRAPAWLREIGLEWAYRLYREPSRWRRMTALPRFVLTVLTHKWLKGGKRS